MGIENWTNLNPTEEGEKNIDTKNPSNGAFIVVLQLVFVEVLMEYTNNVPIV